MPGYYPPDAECCIRVNGNDCNNRVEHSAAVAEPAGVRRYFLCADHWPQFSQAFKQAVEEL